MREHVQSHSSRNSIFEQLEHLAKEQQLQLRQFWKGNRVCINFEEFEQMAKESGIQFIAADRRELQEQFPEQLITLKALHQRIPSWLAQPLNIGEFIQQKATELLKQMTTATSRTQSVPKHRNKPCATLHTDKSFIETSEKAMFDERRRLKQYRDRMKRSELLLNKSIIRNRNESEFELVLKIAEANEICTKLKNNQSFTITKEQGRPPIIILLDPQAKEKQEEITMRRFETKFFELKEKSINTATYQKETNNTDLKHVLTETMFLSQQLQAQMQLLRSRGLTSDSVLK